MVGGSSSFSIADAPSIIFAWYQPLVCKKPVQQKPRIVEAGADLWWQLDWPKTCSPRHFDCMEIEAIGTLPIAMERREHDSRRGGPGSCSSAGVAVAQRSMTSQLPTP